MKHRPTQCLLLTGTSCINHVVTVTRLLLFTSRHCPLCDPVCDHVCDPVPGLLHQILIQEGDASASLLLSL